MSDELCATLPNIDKSVLFGVEIDELLEHYEFYLRVSRGAWLKHKYGDTKIPSDLFATVVDADVPLKLLDRWFEEGGIQCVYFYCKYMFNGGDYADYGRVREVQDEIARSQKGTSSTRSKKGGSH